jgi:hypothetical protein
MALTLLGTANIDKFSVIDGDQTQLVYDRRKVLVAKQWAEYQETKIQCIWQLYVASYISLSIQKSETKSQNC